MVALVTNQAVQEPLEMPHLLKVHVPPWLVGGPNFILFIFDSELGGEGAVVEALPQVQVEHETPPLPACATHCCHVMQQINVGQHEQHHLVWQLLHLLTPGLTRAFGSVNVNFGKSWKKLRIIGQCSIGCTEVSRFSKLRQKLAKTENGKCNYNCGLLHHHAKSFAFP
jgi:hypothetical protein